MTAIGYERLSNDLASNDQLDLQGNAENLDIIAKSLPLSRASRILDVGCGSGKLTNRIAALVGPRCEVIGIDKSSQHIEFARRQARSLGLTNIRYIFADIFDLSREFQESFDVVYEKYLMMYLTPQDLGGRFVTTLQQLLRPSGTLALIEADINFGQDRYPPPSADLQLVLEEVVRYYRKNGLIEWRSGAQLFHYLQLAGCTDVNITLLDGRIIAGGMPRELAIHDGLGIEELILPCVEKIGLNQSANMLAQEWREYLSRRDTFIYTPVFMGTGRRLTGH